MCECEGEPNTAIKNIEKGRTNQLAAVCQQCGQVIERIGG